MFADATPVSVSGAQRHRHHTFNYPNMRHLKTVLVALLLVCGSALPASAKLLRFGPRVGVALNSMHFNDKIFSADNRTGFTGGVTADLHIPVVGIGLEVSAMYVHRTAAFSYDNGKEMTAKRDYFEIPVHLKWRLGLPVISPYIFTGPDFAFGSVGDIWGGKRNAQTSWDLGLGIELFSHLQVSATYGIGLDKFKLAESLPGRSGDYARNRCWTVTAAYMF